MVQEFNRRIKFKKQQSCNREVLLIMVKIGAVGDNCIDMYDNIGEFYVGGNPVNVAVYIKRLGGNADYAGVVGNDRYGELVKEQLYEKGVDVSMVKTIEGSTAISHIDLINKERVFGEYEEGVLPQLLLAEEELKRLAECDIVVSSVWSYTESYFERLKRLGAITAMDFSTELDSEVIDVVGAYLDYAFFSFEEGNMELEEFMKDIFERIRGIVIVTRGEEGSVVYDGKQFIYHGIEPCEVIDTLGAGDSFIAGFLYGMAEGLSIKDSMMKGAKNSSVTIGYKGAW